MSRVSLILIILTLLGQWSFGQTDDLRTKHFNVKNSIALAGFDPVSYFDGTPAQGDPKFKFLYRGVVYHFISPTNLSKFKSSPEKFEPAYGGWCAYAMGETGEKVKIDPDTYTFLDGKLYLFYNFWGNNTLTDWKKNEKKLKETADRNWQAIIR